MASSRFVTIIELTLCSFLMIESCTWSPEHCGCWYNYSTSGNVAKIVGGFESTPHSWPWVVSIRKRSSDIPLGLPICGGTIINEQHILTAAHCFYDNLVKDKKSISSYLFVIGSHYSTDTHVYSDSIIRYDAAAIIIHEHYNPHRQINDIAIVKLQEKLNFNNIRVGAICLPGHNEIYTSDGVLTVAIGWGRLFQTATDISETLQQVLLMIVEGQQCDRIKSGNQVQTQLCAGSADSKSSQDTCQGDSGGPLMVQASNDAWFIIGITSYGKGCGQLNELGVYTRVSAYLKWIQSATKNLQGHSFRSRNKLNNIFLNSSKCSHASRFILLVFLIIHHI